MEQWQTGNVTINGVIYTFAASGEAIGDKIPTPTLAFTSAGVAVTLDTTEIQQQKVLIIHQVVVVEVLLLQLAQTIINNTY